MAMDTAIFVALDVAVPRRGGIHTLLGRQFGNEEH